MDGFELLILPLKSWELGFNSSPTLDLPLPVDFACVLETLHAISFSIVVLAAIVAFGIHVPNLDTAQSFESSLCFVNHGANGSCFGALLVELLLDHSYELLPSLVGSIFIENVVKVQYERPKIVDFLRGLAFNLDC
jgi:hypothetical protein